MRPSTDPNAPAPVSKDCHVETHIPLAVTDVSAFARSLRQQLAKADGQPSHVEMLNMLARANGHRNFQHLRAGAAEATPEAPDYDHAKVEQVLRHFDEAGRMVRWPGRTHHQTLCLWGIWAYIPAGERLSESEINSLITRAHSFGDYAILRRSMVDAAMLARTPDGRVYRRIEKAPPPEGAALMAEVARRAGL